MSVEFYKTCKFCGCKLDLNEKCDCIQAMQFRVSHYGILYDDYNTVLNENYIRQKVYKYKDCAYIETWHNGKIILFAKLD